jgi:hypothetical protein
MRLVDRAMIPTGPTKVSATADLLAGVYQENKDWIYTDPSTGQPDPVPGALQIVFCDLGTPSERWNVYGELKDQLRRRGLPGHLVKFMHDTTPRTTPKRASSSPSPRSGHGDVLVGSTLKMGVGTNIQKHAVHLSCPKAVPIVFDCPLGAHPKLTSGRGL